jgi:hypothetical protein
VEWDPSFREAIQGIYTGFYDQEDGLFERSLRSIGMSGMSEIFREHFGFGGQREVTFRMEDFRETFADVLSAAKDRGATIHPDFVGLGIYLTALYEHLEALGGAYDVRAAYQEATRRSSAA